MASAPVTFDARQWRRQVRAAQGRTAAPGSVPLLARGGRIPVGGTIRAVGVPVAAGVHPPGRRVRAAHGHHRRDRRREDQPDDAAVGGLVHRRPRRALRRDRGTGRC